jgi:hypothetical protein
LKLTETELYHVAMALDNLVRDTLTKQRKVRASSESEFRLQLANLEKLEQLIVRASIHDIVSALKSLEKE